MKKSQLRKIIKEELGTSGFSKYKAGGKTTGSGADFSEILWNLVHGKDQETRGNETLDQADPENVARISRGEEPIYEGEGKLYGKAEVINYINTNPPAKYYKIGVSKGTSQTLRDAEQAIEVVKQSPIKQFELDTHGDVIQFSAPYDEAHGAAVKGMGLD